ncbi:MAG: hypothetical protein ABI882_04660 [Acidobacteriota bacterium]
MKDQDTQITKTDATGNALADLDALNADEIKGGPTPQNKRTIVLQSSLTVDDSSGE